MNLHYATLPDHEALYRFVAQLLELSLVAQPHFRVPLRCVTEVHVIVDQDLRVLGDIFGGSKTSDDTEPWVLYNDPLRVGPEKWPCTCVSALELSATHPPTTELAFAPGLDAGAEPTVASFIYSHVGMVDFVRKGRAVILKPHAVEGNVQVDVGVQTDPVVGVPEVLCVV